MSSFVNANLDSDSDSDDQDYDPTVDRTAEVASEEDESGDDESGVKMKKKGKKNAKTELLKFGKRSFGGILMLEDDEERKREEERKKEFEKEKHEMKEEEEKKKVDDLWASFKQEVVPPKPTSVAKPKPVGSGLGSWSMAGSKAKHPVKKVVAVATKKPPTDLFSSIFDTPVVKREEEKSSVTTPKSIFASIFEKIETPKNGDVEQKNETTKDHGIAEDPDKVTITKVFDFAGESVKVTKQVSKDSKEALKFLKESSTQETEASTSQKRPAAGLSSIMGVISGKKPKMGTLEKSKMDWNHFVEKEGIKEDLQTFNKGKDGFVEKQMFLERTDQRRFEIEKAAREKTRKNL